MILVVVIDESRLAIVTCGKEAPLPVPKTHAEESFWSFCHEPNSGVLDLSGVAGLGGLHAASDGASESGAGDAWDQVLPAEALSVDHSAGC